MSASQWCSTAMSGTSAMLRLVDGCDGYDGYGHGGHDGHDGLDGLDGLDGHYGHGGMVYMMDMIDMIDMMDLTYMMDMKTNQENMMTNQRSWYHFWSHLLIILILFDMYKADKKVYLQINPDSIALLCIFWFWVCRNIFWPKDWLGDDSPGSQGLWVTTE